MSAYSHLVNAATRQLSTAAERREALVDAAADVFAERGFHGTPTTAIARAAGISQAYLFRLFPTKEELYVAAVGRCYERISRVMSEAAERARADGEPPLDHMGMAYGELMQDASALRATLHAFAAASGGDPAIRDAVRDGYGDLVRLIQRVSGADDEAVRAFVAKGMMMTVLAGMDAPSLDVDWVRTLLGEEHGQC